MTKNVYVQIGKKNNGRYNKSKVEFNLKELEKAIIAVRVLNLAQKVPEYNVLDKLFNTKKYKEYKNYLLFEKDQDLKVQQVKETVECLQFLLD
jgi:hypothetical protein